MNVRALRTSVSAFLLSLGSIAAGANPPAVTVSVTDLGTLGGSASYGFGVNDKGQVVGTSQLPGDKIVHGFFYADGKMTDLGTLGGDTSEARALNGAGQVTGSADFQDKDRHHAFLWQQGRMTDLGTSRADNSDGMAINASGRVAGRIVRGGFWYGSSRACFWSDGKVNTLDRYDMYWSSGTSESRAINDRGQVAGELNKPGRRFTDKKSGISGQWFSDYAALWQGRKASELGPPGTEISLANAINGRGEAAGAVSVGPDLTLHACVWQGGKMTDLGTLAGLNTVVYAINEAGLMVGGTSPDEFVWENGRLTGSADQPQRAICCSGGQMIDLNDLLDPASGWVLGDARGISGTGYVTGTGLHNGQAHAYLLKLPPVF